MNSGRDENFVVREFIVDWLCSIRRSGKCGLDRENGVDGFGTAAQSSGDKSPRHRVLFTASLVVLGLLRSPAGMNPLATGFFSLRVLWFWDCCAVQRG